MFPDQGFLPENCYLRIIIKNVVTTQVISLLGLLENESGFDPISINFTPSSAGLFTAVIPLGKCKIHSLRIRQSNAMLSPTCMPVDISIYYGGESTGIGLTTLIQGFLDNMYFLCYPYVPLPDNRKIFRNTYVYTSNPAAGTGASCPGVAGLVLKPFFVGGIFTTEVTAGNRNLQLTMSYDGVTMSGLSLSPANLVASNTYQFTFNLNTPTNTLMNNGSHNFLPNALILPSGSMNVSANGIKANDQFTNVVYYCEVVDIA
jgi:hypothetical protein